MQQKWLRKAVVVGIVIICVSISSLQISTTLSGSNPVSLMHAERTITADESQDVYHQESCERKPDQYSPLARTSEHLIARLNTSKGTIVLLLYANKTPITVGNFVNLSTMNFYDGLLFHLIYDDFWIRGGGYYPNGTLKLGPFDPIPLEIHPDVRHVDGAISMSRTSDPNSATTQFFICDGPQAFLDDQYAAFGVVINGIDVVRDIADDPHDNSNPVGGGRPLVDIIINSVTILDSDVVFVDDDNTAGPWDGTLEHPYQYIQDGIDTVDEYGTVFVAAGLYVENLVISKPLSLIGEQRNITIIDSGNPYLDGVVITANQVVVSGFTVQHNHIGILVDGSPSCEIADELITENAGNGILLQNCCNCQVHHTHLSWNGEGGIVLAAGPDSSCEIYENTINHNTQDGVQVFMTSHCEVTNNEIDSNGWAGVYVAQSTECLFAHNTMTNNSEALYIDPASHCWITHNTMVQNRGAGIVVHFPSKSNRISSNYISGNTDGIYLESTDYNLLNNNAIVDNTGNGIVSEGDPAQNTHNVMYNNQIMYNGESGVSLISSVNCPVVSNVVSYNGNGISLSGGATECAIAGNTVEGNIWEGIWVNGASGNQVYHNTVLGNTPQAYDVDTNMWDDGPDFGGNYWDDYLIQNPGAVDANGDGFWDTPYVITGGVNTDHYPLVTQYMPSIKNLDTLELFATLQAALDDPDTLQGHTLLASSGVYTEDVAVNKAVSLVGEQSETTIVEGTGFGSTMTVTADDVTISEVTITNGGMHPQAGLLVDSVENVCVTDAYIIHNKGIGVSIPGGDGHVLDTNQIMGNDYLGIDLQGSDTEIIANTIQYNSIAGLMIFNGPNTLVDSNSIGYNFDDGISIQGTNTGTQLQNNQITHNIDSGVSIAYSGALTIMNNNISANQQHGISLWDSSNNQIQGNAIGENQGSGVALQGTSQGNTLQTNALFDNTYTGVICQGGSSNNLFFNNYFGNSNNAIDDGVNLWNITKTPGMNIIGGPYLGGNYWSDYTGVDLDGDGLGDTNVPHTSNGGIQLGGDYLPIVIPSGPLPTMVWVDDNYTNATPGWGYDHFSTIQNGVNGVASGGVVTVYNGLYEENVLINKPLQLYGEDREHTIIDGGNLTNTVRIVASHVVFNGCTVTNGNSVYPNAGIYLDNVEGTIVNHNKIVGNNGHGVFSMWGTGNQIYDNIVENNTLTGIRVDGPEANASVHHNTVSHNQDTGIFIYYAGTVLVEHNVVTNNTNQGISPQGNSLNITIRNNTVSGNTRHGIWVAASPFGVDVYDNAVSDNQQVGLYVYLSSGTHVSHNSFTNDGMYVRGSYENTVSMNTVNGKPLVYLEGVSSETVPATAGQVILVNCSNVTVHHLNLSCVDVGVELWNTAESMLITNTITSNLYGIRLLGSQGNLIRNNSLMGNNVGLSCDVSTTNNSVFDNYFQNTQNAFDEGTNHWNIQQPEPAINIIGGPYLGGNYWSDFDEPAEGAWDINGDGIGDAAYDIPGGANRDYMPLIPPYPTVNVSGTIYYNGTQSGTLGLFICDQTVGSGGEPNASIMLSGTGEYTIQVPTGNYTVFLTAFLDVNDNHMFDTSEPGGYAINKSIYQQADAIVITGEDVSGVDITLFEFYTMNITGTVFYEGAHQDPIYVMVFDQYPTGGVQPITHVMLSAPGDYTVRVPNGSYYLAAFMDLNGNMMPDYYSEPLGMAINNTLPEGCDLILINGSDVGDVDITLYEYDTYDIEGQVFYEGTTNGTIYVLFFNDNYPGEPIAYAELSAPGEYRCAVPNGSYYVGAFLDVNGDRYIDMWTEPFGWAINHTIHQGYDMIIVDGSNVTSVDITLQLFINTAPMITDEHPADGSTQVSRPPGQLNATIVDAEADAFSVFIRWRNHQGDWVTLSNYSQVGNGTYMYTPSGNDWIWGNTTYTWSVNVTDGFSWTNETYSYITKGSRYDVNNNNIVNFQDAGLVWVHRTSIAPYDPLYDVNGNGVVNFQDAGLVWVHRD